MLHEHKVVVFDLLNELKSSIKEYPQGEMKPRSEEYIRTQFDGEVAKLFSIMLELMSKGESVKKSWQSKAVSFTLDYNVEFVNQFRLCIKDIQNKIAELQKKIKEEVFEQRDKLEGEFQTNVCKSLECYLIRLVDTLKTLKNYVSEKKAKTDEVLNVNKQNNESEPTLKETPSGTEEKYVPNVDPEYKAEALMLEQYAEKNKQAIMESLEEIFHLTDTIKMEALRQEDIAIEFKDNNILSLENILGGKRELASANKNEGESGEYWMWFFITLTIMIVIIDFVKK